MNHTLIKTIPLTQPKIQITQIALQDRYQHKVFMTGVRYYFPQASKNFFLLNPADRRKAWGDTKSIQGTDKTS